MRGSVLCFLVCGVALTTPAGARNTPPTVDPIAQFAAAFEGKWKIEVTLPGEAGKPATKVGDGETRFYPGPGGRSFVEDYRSKGPEGEMSGLGVIWWSPETKAYEVVWCDSGSPDGCARVKGGARWESNDFVSLTSEVREGKKVNIKEVFSKSAKDGFAQTIYEAPEGGDWKAVVVIRAQRVK